MTSKIIQILLDALYKVYEDKKTFHPVDTATLLAEMFKVQRGLTREYYDGKQLTGDDLDGLTERLFDLARAVEADDRVFEALLGMNRLVWPTK